MFNLYDPVSTAGPTINVKDLSFNCLKCMLRFIESIKINLDDDIISLIDTNVYKNNQSMRMANQSKIGQNNILRIVSKNHNINDTYIKNKKDNK